jgi:hypothetical protein
MTRFGAFPERGGHLIPPLYPAFAHARRLVKVGNAYWYEHEKPHRMRTAFVSRGVARRMGLNRNHHIRVWCDCMDLSSGMPWGDENDPRRLGTFDALGVVDSREAGSALDLYRRHLKEEGAA